MSLVPGMIARIAPAAASDSPGPGPGPTLLGWGVFPGDDGVIRQSGNTSRAVLLVPEASGDPFGILDSVTADEETGEITVALNNPPGFHYLPSTAAWFRFPQSAIVVNDTPPNFANPPAGDAYGMRWIVDIIAPPSSPACLWRLSVGIGDSAEGPSSLAFNFAGGGYGSSDFGDYASVTIGAETGPNDRATVSANGGDRLIVIWTPVRGSLGFLTVHAIARSGGAITSTTIATVHDFTKTIGAEWRPYILCGIASQFDDGPHALTFKITASPFTNAELSVGDP